MIPVSTLINARLSINCISAFTAGSSWVGPSGPSVRPFPAPLLHRFRAVSARLVAVWSAPITTALNLDTFPPQSSPKPLVSSAPGAQFGVGIFARIDVGEGGGFGIDRNGQFQGKVAGLFPHGSLIDAVGNPLAVDAQHNQNIRLLRLGRKPGQLRVFQHIVEREQPPEHDGILRFPAVTDVLNSQRPVDVGL